MKPEIPMNNSVVSEAAVFYLARGADLDCDEKFVRFIQSYIEHDAGVLHTLYVGLKGFSSEDHRVATVAKFGRLNPVFIELEDNRFDVGAYIDGCSHINEEFVCFFNTHAELLAPNWLKHFISHLKRREVGLVSASGSFESLQLPGLVSQVFPNPHIRTNGFALRKSMLILLFKNYQVNTKLDAYAFESGHESLTRRMVSRGYAVLIVGRNGRAYPPIWWPASNTFRQGNQSNLLVADNQTRNFDNASTAEKTWLLQLAWGSQIELSDTLPDM